MSAKPKEKKQQPVANKETKETTLATAESEATNLVTDELTTALEEIVEEKPKAEKIKGELVTPLDDSNFLVGDRQFRLVANHREGFDAQKLGERYSDVLSRYDYIVGDWGYEQLRLKGFFRADNRRAHPDQRIDSLEDYLYEYCNFGCAYFVIERIGGGDKKEKPAQRRKKKKNYNQTAYIDEKKGPVSSSHKKPVIKKRKETPKKATAAKESVEQPANEKANFTIRKRKES